MSRKNSFKDKPIDEVIKMHDTSQLSHFTARTFIMFLLYFSFSMIIIPWQQTSIGSGKVIAFSPEKRMQNINAPFTGKIKEWKVKEGQKVKKNQPILELVDVDPLLFERLKVEKDAVKSKYEAAKAMKETTNYDYLRQKDLFEHGISSRKDFELASIALKNAQSVEAAILSELTQAQSKLARQSHQIVRAPESGHVVRLIGGSGSVLISEGSTIAEFIPEGEDLIVEIRVPGIDLPLIRKGRRARLQFEGWPSIQFAGWPSVAVGTFGGYVSFIDFNVDQDGYARVFITRGPEDKWPKNYFIRQGTRANSWIILNSVPLGFEIWRQFNGFPPSIDVKGDL